MSKEEILEIKYHNTILKYKMHFNRLYNKHLDINIKDKKESLKEITENIIDIPSLINILNQHIPSYIKPSCSNILDKSRKREVVELRMILCKILRDKCYTLQYIANEVKIKHTSVIYNVNCANMLYKTNQYFREVYDLVKEQVKIPEQNGGVIKTINRVPDKPKPVASTILSTRKKTHFRAHTYNEGRSFSVSKTRSADY